MPLSRSPSCSPAALSTTVDLVVGVPNEDIGSVADAGAISVIKDVYDEEFPGS